MRVLLPVHLRVADERLAMIRCTHAWTLHSMRLLAMRMAERRPACAHAPAHKTRTTRRWTLRNITIVNCLWVYESLRSRQLLPAGAPLLHSLMYVTWTASSALVSILAYIFWGSALGQPAWPIPAGLEVTDDRLLACAAAAGCVAHLPGTLDKITCCGTATPVKPSWMKIMS
jgi:hypothetical protein